MSYSLGLDKIKLGEKYVGSSCGAESEDCHCIDNTKIIKEYVGRECVSYETYKCNCRSVNYNALECDKVVRSCSYCKNYGIVRYDRKCHIEWRIGFMFIPPFFYFYPVNVCNYVPVYGCISYGYYDCSYYNCRYVPKSKVVCDTCSRCSSYRDVYRDKVVNERKCYVTEYVYKDNVVVDYNGNVVNYSNDYPIEVSNGSFLGFEFSNVNNITYVNIGNKSIRALTLDNVVEALSEVFPRDIARILAENIFPILLLMFPLYVSYQLFGKKKSENEVINFLRGIIYGEVDSVGGFFGDVALSLIPLGDLRDILFYVMQKSGYELGEDIDNITLGFATFGLALDIGILSGVGEVANGVVGAVKSVWKRIPRGIRKVIIRNVDDIGEFAIKMGEVFSKLFKKGKVTIEGSFDAISMYFKRLGKYFEKGGKDIEKFNEIFIYAMEKGEVDEIFSFLGKHIDDVERFSAEEIRFLSKVSKESKEFVGMFKRLLESGLDTKVLEKGLERVSKSDLYKIFKKDKVGAKRLLVALSKSDVKLTILQKSLDSAEARWIAESVEHLNEAKRLFTKTFGTIGNGIDEIVFTDSKVFKEFKNYHGFYDSVRKRITLDVNSYIFRKNEVERYFMVLHEAGHSFSCLRDGEIIRALKESGAIPAYLTKRDIISDNYYKLLANQAHDLVVWKYMDKVGGEEFSKFTKGYVDAMKDRNPIIHIMERLSKDEMNLIEDTKVRKVISKFMDGDKLKNYDLSSAIVKGDIKDITIGEIKELLKGREIFTSEWMVVDKSAEEIINKVKKILTKYAEEFMKYGNEEELIKIKDIKAIINKDIINLKHTFKEMLKGIKT